MQQLTSKQLKISLVSFGKRERIRMSSLCVFLREFSKILEPLEGYSLNPFIEEEGKINEYSIRGNDINVWCVYSYFNEATFNEYLEMKRIAESESSTKVIIFLIDGSNITVNPNDYILFDNLDTLKVRMVQYLSAYLDLNIYSLYLDKYNLLFEGKEVKGINIEYVLEFNNNRNLQQLTEELDSQMDTYKRYVSPLSKPDDIDLKKAAQLGFNYEALIRNREYSYLRIIIASSRMVYAKYHDSLTSETDKNYNDLFKGLLYKESEDVDPTESIRLVPTINSLKEAEEFIAVTLFKIDLAFSRGSTPIDHTEKLYKAALSVSLRYHIRGDVAFAYIDYISQTYLSDKVISLVESSLPDILACDFFASPYQIALLYYKMALTYQDNEEKNLAIKFFALAVSILEDIVKDNPYKYTDILSKIYLEYGEYLVEKYENDRATILLNSAIKMLSPKIEENPRVYKERMALYYFYLGNAYYDMYDLKKGLINYQKALTYIDHYSEDILTLLEDTITSFITVAMELNEFEGVESLLFDLLELDKLFYSYDPVNFEYDISEAYQLLGTYYAHEGKSDKALSYYQQAFKKREALIDINPSLFGVGYSVTCVGLATAYLEKGETQKTIDYLEEGRDALEPLYKVKPYEVGNELSSIYLDLGTTYISLNDYKRAEDSYLNAISIQERFAGGSANPQIAFMYHNLGVLYEKMGEDKKSEQAFRKGLKNLDGYNSTNFPQYDSVIDTLNSCLDRILKKLDGSGFVSALDNAA